MNCSPMSGDVSKFHAELNQASENAKITINRMLKDMAISDAGLAHVLSQSFYLRLPAFMANWTIEREKRLVAAEQMIIHCVGLKMYDDMVDGDQAVSNFDMTGGVHLMSHAIHNLTRLAKDGEIVDLFLENYGEIWKSITQYRGRQSVSTLEEWIESASIQGGKVFECYAVAACMVSGSKSSIEGAKKFSDGFGKIIVMYDDFVDHLEANELDGNIAHLYRIGEASRDAIVEILEQARSDALGGIAASSCAYDISSIVNAKADGMLAKLVEFDGRDTRREVADSR
jgi:hypothetical protein